jgi:predicted RNA-binding Zn-ribbon protein involved in translation (DUF1610 family)
MPSATERLRCPRCGAQMNRHAEKLVYGHISGSPADDALLGGHLEETHACPGCGNVLARRV